jgi:hypothetical protein
VGVIDVGESAPLGDIEVANLRVVGGDAEDATFSSRMLPARTSAVLFCSPATLEARVMPLRTASRSSMVSGGRLRALFHCPQNW